MSNVAALNFCFDVPVKLYSSNLVLMAVFLAWPDLYRVAGVLVLNRPASPVTLSRPWPAKGMSLAAVCLKVFVIGWMLWSTIGADLKNAKPRPSWLTGLYRVDSISRNGQPVALLATDARLWRQVGVDSYGPLDVMTVRTMDETSQRFNVSVDQEHGQLTLKARGVAAPAPIVLRYRWEATDKLLLEGQFDGEALSVVLGRVPANHYLLVNRGFHWISEAPFNR